MQYSQPKIHKKYKKSIKNAIKYRTAPIKPSGKSFKTMTVTDSVLLFHGFRNGIRHGIQFFYLGFLKR